MRKLGGSFKWLYPGMNVKRWLALVPIGMFVCILGIVLIANIRVLDVAEWLAPLLLERFGIDLSAPKTAVLIGAALILLGLLVIFFSFRQVVTSIANVLMPDRKGSLGEMIYQRRSLAQGQRIVVIGGGTGLSTMLRGLKEYTSNIVAIVTVTDDGGSSGRLTRERGILPPGDIRNCLVALADAEPLMQQLFQYRFGANDVNTQDHSFGNLLIAALTDITGDFEMAVKETSKVLAIRGRVFPSTVQNVTLCAELEDGTLAEGETKIAASGKAIRHVFLHPADVKPLNEALQALALADIIVLGPGSVFTSIIPNLLVNGIAEAIANSDAIKIYVCNVMTQPGESDGFTASDHIRAIINHSDKKLFTHVLVNRERPREELLEKYRQEHADLVVPDVEKIREIGFRPHLANLISQTQVVRHDPERLAQAIFKLAS